MRSNPHCVHSCDYKSTCFVMQACSKTLNLVVLLYLSYSVHWMNEFSIATNGKRSARPVLADLTESSQDSAA